jgi:hypothetical protein
VPGQLQLGNGGKPFPAEVQQKLLTGLIRKEQYNRCPGGGDVVAPDRSNVLSPDLQKALDCKESDRAAGNYTPGG